MKKDDSYKNAMKLINEWKIVIFWIKYKHALICHGFAKLPSWKNKLICCKYNFL